MGRKRRKTAYQRMAALACAIALVLLQCAFFPNVSSLRASAADAGQVLDIKVHYFGDDLTTVPVWKSYTRDELAALATVLAIDCVLDAEAAVSASASVSNS